MGRFSVTNKNLAGIILFLLCTFLTGCIDNSLSTPNLRSEKPVNTTNSLEDTHVPWFFGYVTVYDAESESPTAVFTPVRQTLTHKNVLTWLENNPCSDCLKIAGITPTPDGTIIVNIEISHPFDNPNFTGFDVRGIVMFDASKNFPVLGLTTQDANLGDAALVNADGYTSLYNPSTIGMGAGGMEGYQPGKLSNGTPDCLLNGYKRYISDGPTNIRNIFLAGDTIISDFEIIPPGGPFVFGYAVDSSWAMPDNLPVTDPVIDFPISANCEEPWKIDVDIDPVDAGLMDDGGTVILTIDVFDWQGKDSHGAPVVECPGIFMGTLTAGWVEDGVGYSRWEVTAENTNLAQGGKYLCLISVEDSLNDPIGKPWLDLTTYQIVALRVYSTFEPIEVTPADLNIPNALDVVVSDGYAYVTCGKSVSILDVSVPEEAVLLNTVNLGYETGWLDVQGKYLYVNYYIAGGVKVLNATDPLNVFEVADIPATGGPVYADGAYAYTNAGAMGIQLHDIDPPEEAHYIKHIQYTPPEYYLFTDFVLQDGYGYVMDDYTLHVMDIDPPESGEFITQINLGTTGWDLDVWDHYIFSVRDVGIQAVDIANPTAPVDLGVFPTETMPMEIAVIDGIAYIAEFGKLEIMNVTDPTSPVLIKGCAVPGAYQEIAVDGDYVYLADSYGGDKFRIFKVW